jgi:hypothetical protein
MADPMGRLDEQEAALRVLGAHYDELIAHPGVVTTGVGLRERGGQITDELCIIIGVEKKLPASQLGSAEVLPRTLDGVGVDVQQRRDLVPLIRMVDPRELEDWGQYRPLKGGSQISNLKLNPSGQVSLGTLGAIVLVTPGGNSPDAPFVGLLSNQHVLYAIGGQNGDSIFQPAARGAMVATNYTGRKDSSRPFVDAGVARIASGIGITNEVLRIGTLTGMAAPIPESRVRKYGYYTEYTVGMITQLFVERDGLDSYVYGFRVMSAAGQDGSQFPLLDPNRKFADEGDSGSVIVNDNNRVVGLLCAGTREAPWAVDCDSIYYLSDHWMILTIPAPASQIVDLREDLARLSAYAETLRRTEAGRQMLEAFAGSFEEFRRLIHSNGECAKTWKTLHGAAFLPLRAEEPADMPYRIRKEVDGVPLPDLLSAMARLFATHGSPELAERIRTHGERFIRHACACDTVEEAVEAFCTSD